MSGNERLEKACKMKDAEAIRAALDAGADPNCRSAKGEFCGMTPLMILCRGLAESEESKDGLAEMFRMVIEAGGDPDALMPDGDWSALMMLADWGDGKLVSALLRLGADPNLWPTNEDAWGHWDALHLAAANGEAESVRALLEGGAKDEPDREGDLAEDLAEQNGEEGALEEFARWRAKEEAKQIGLSSKPGARKSARRGI